MFVFPGCEKYWNAESLEVKASGYLQTLYFIIHLCSDAAAVMLSGQLADGFTTIFAGELVWPMKQHDPCIIISTHHELNFFSICCAWFWGRYINKLLLFQIDRFGHFKLWHAGGSILVAISFSSVFGSCVPCKLMGTSSSTLETVGYSTFAAIFNVGWAVTQVAHM